MVIGKEKQTDVRGLFQLVAGTQARANRRVNSSTHCRTGVKKFWERLLLKIRF